MVRNIRERFAKVEKNGRFVSSATQIRSTHIHQRNMLTTHGQLDVFEKTSQCLMIVYTSYHACTALGGGGMMVRSPSLCSIRSGKAGTVKYLWRVEDTLNLPSPPPPFEVEFGKFALQPPPSLLLPKTGPHCICGGRNLVAKFWVTVNLSWEPDTRD